MSKIGILLILGTLFVGFNAYADDEEGEQGETKVYIVYRDTNGKMIKTPVEVVSPTSWLATGHVGFLIVNSDGSSYVVDTIPDPDGNGPLKSGVRKTNLEGFSDQQAQNLWFFDTGLSSDQTNELINWLNARIGVNEKGDPKYPYNGNHQSPKGPNQYDCVGLVEAAMEMLKINLTPKTGENSENFYLLPYEQLIQALAKLKAVDITDIFGGERPPQPTKPSEDHPDDYMGVLGGPILRESACPLANVAVVYNGFPKEASGIINDSCWLGTGFELEDAKKYPALIIPSGGFFGMDTSEILKYKLRKYVEDGGVIVCFAQQQGYEFNCLPGTITAYGWGEDQSCWQNAAYIDTDHPIFASQEDAALDAGIDGYFTQWPNDATILLRRTKNQMPAMLMYKYGSGTVIASTLFSDFASGHG